MILLALLSAAAGLAEAPATLPRGIVVEKVDCAAVPGQSYALYLPTNYSVERVWPILYLFDARARGKLPARLFQEAAEKYGYILASSNNTMSDGPVDPNITALRAVWYDTHARFSIDQKRVYASGFSGGARVATTMATFEPGAVAGVIGCGAGFHAPIRTRPPFVYFGTVGNRDFNYGEMRSVDATLDGFHLPHRVEIFSGEHDWPPKELAEKALAWMDLQAMKDKRLPVNQRFVDLFFEEESNQATALEADRPDEALRLWKMLREDAEEIRKFPDLDATIARLSESSRVKKILREERDRAQRDEAFLQKLPAIWEEIKTPGEVFPFAHILQELEIPALRRRALSSPGSEDSLSAERLLGQIYSMTGFYLARDFQERKNLSRALLCASIAVEAKPDRAPGWYNLAALHAVSGHAKQAIENLKLAVAKGFRDGEYLAKDSDFASLSTIPEFQKIVTGLRETSPAGQ